MSIFREILVKKYEWEGVHGRCASHLLIPADRLDEFADECAKVPGFGDRLFGLRVQTNLFRGIDIA